ncbi:MAG: DNA polymerase I, partial [Synergistales bacterium]|nr:DNA polymerase I [Synergistales bacterium]
DVTVLEQLAELPVEASEIPKLLLEHRELSKMSSGFAVPLLKAERDGVIHSSFEADTTGTGRLSSRDPNLQNLPAYGEWSERICRCLVPRGKDRCFVAADYSQIELRVLAHISGEPRLVEVFEKGRDIHTETAAMVFGIDPSLVTKELRRSAKMVAFGLLYGMSAFGLAKRLGVGQNEAKEIMSRYFKALPGVEAYMTKSSDRAISLGYTETILGRRRPLDEVETGNARDKGHMKRVAINSPIQGTAADLAKKAMIEVDRSLKGGEMVLQVHDSIVCECDQEDSQEVLRSLQAIMESVASLSVPLVTEGKIGASLAEV